MSHLCATVGILPVIFIVFLTPTRRRSRTTTWLRHGSGCVNIPSKQQHRYMSDILCCRYIIILWNLNLISKDIAFASPIPNCRFLSWRHIRTHLCFRRSLLAPCQTSHLSTNNNSNQSIQYHLTMIALCLLRRFSIIKLQLLFIKRHTPLCIYIKNTVDLSKSQLYYIIIWETSSLLVKKLVWVFGRTREQNCKLGKIFDHRIETAFDIWHVSTCSLACFNTRSGSFRMTVRQVRRFERCLTATHNEGWDAPWRTRYS